MALILWLMLLTIGRFHVFCIPKEPSIFISVLIRNKAHLLPYFLTSLEKQSYPKSRIILYLRSDNNQDDSIQLLEDWLKKIVPRREYHDIIKDFKSCDTDSCLLDGETSPVGWSDTRFQHIMKLRQQSLDMARFSLADFYFSLDCDVLLTDEDTIRHLVDKEVMIVAPVLGSIGLYSNFWAGMSDTYYYQRTDDYKKILNRKQVGCFQVPMVHSAVLVDLRYQESDLLTYIPGNIDNYPGPVDDIIVFALSASLRSIPLHICNDHYYGSVSLPLEDGQDFEYDKEILRYTLLEVTARSLPLVPDTFPGQQLVNVPPGSKMGLDEVFMINLERRKDRYERMKYNLDLLGIKYKHVAAVDGRTLNQDYIDLHGIKMMPEFSEPYHGRPLTYGEIGCFMSHYNTWKEIVDRNLDTTLVFEDDIRFEAFFKDKLEYLLKELATIRDKWDIVYIGRKILHNAVEDWLPGSDQLVTVDYTYWTLAYIISKKGAEKLIKAEPLNKMLPVDEYLPIMYNRHHNESWYKYFPVRDLSALSVHPLLVQPTHYTGEMGYVSDTEDTGVINIHEENINIGMQDKVNEVDQDAGPEVDKNKLADIGIQNKEEL